MADHGRDGGFRCTEPFRGEDLKPLIYTKAEWQPIVRKGRKLVKRHSSFQFALGDLVIGAISGHPRGHGEVAEVIEILGYQIGNPVATLWSYYKVAMQWPEAKRWLGVCWSVHERLAYVRSRFILIRKDPYDPISKEKPLDRERGGEGREPVLGHAEQQGRVARQNPASPAQR